MLTFRGADDDAANRLVFTAFRAIRDVLQRLRAEVVTHSTNPSTSRASHTRGGLVMLARFNDFDSSFSVFDTLFDRFNAYEDARAPQPWRRLSVHENENTLTVTLDVPGLNENDIGVAIHDGFLHIRGERKTESKEEAQLVRAAGLKFERSFKLATKVDIEAASAKVADGVLTITLPKAAEAKPYQIKVTGKAA
jgi:HSP20 family protein